MTLLVFLFALAASVYLDQRLRRLESSVYSEVNGHRVEIRDMYSRLNDLEDLPPSPTTTDHRELELRVVELETWKNGRKRRPRTILPPANGESSKPISIPPSSKPARVVLP